MLDLSTLITPARIHCKLALGSKKKALETMSKLLATASPDLNDIQVFDSLLARERLGSTGLGQGIAIPHGRLENISAPIGAFISLEQGIDYDAPDKQAVDLLFGLAVPVNCNQEHLQILAGLASLFNDASITSKLRQQNQVDAVLDCLLTSQPVQHNNR